MFLRFQKIALDVSYDFGQNRSMFLIVVFLIKNAYTTAKDFHIYGAETLFDVAWRYGSRGDIRYSAMLSDFTCRCLGLITS